MQPIKPFGSATVHECKMDESIRKLFPDYSSLWNTLPRQVTCENHIVHGTTDQIALGDDVIVVKFPTGGSRGKPTISAKFYCSIDCQRHAAVSKRTEIRQNREQSDDGC